MGIRYGLASSDIAIITSWLQIHGFQVNVVFPSNNLIDFSGTAGEVRSAFHTEVHRLEVNGEHHVANMSDPEIPAALAPAIAGITSLHDFRPHPMNAGVYDVPAEDFGNGRYVAPADLAIIYNLKPIYAEGISGQGQNIAVLESSDLYSAGDWYAFRRVFGLSRAYPHGTLTQIQPAGDMFPCSDPGAVLADREATLDSEWVTATAPNANEFPGTVIAPTRYGPISTASQPLMEATASVTARPFCQQSDGFSRSGGPSSCAYGTPNTFGIVSGTCSGYPKPAWQAILGNPADGKRDLPDVSLFASAGAWNHGYLICYSDPSRSGSPCTDIFGVSGGTSASSPVMASIQALINQRTDQRWGNPNPVYYALADVQYGSTGSASCYARALAMQQAQAALSTTSRKSTMKSYANRVVPTASLRPGSLA